MEGEPKYRVREFSDEAKPFKQLMNRLGISGNVEDSIGLLDDMAVLGQELENKYGFKEIRKYELFHVLIGSTLKEDSEIIALDLPNKEIYEKIMELEKKYGKV